MNIIINETQESVTLSIIDPRSGLDYISDFVGNAGGLSDGWSVLDENVDAYRCDQETYDWWARVVDDNQSLENRVHALTKKHGSEAVYDVVRDAGSVDLEDYAASVNDALDKAFGEAG